MIIIIIIIVITIIPSRLEKSTYKGKGGANIVPSSNTWPRVLHCQCSRRKWNTWLRVFIILVFLFYKKWNTRLRNWNTLGSYHFKTK